MLHFLPAPAASSRHRGRPLRSTAVVFARIAFACLLCGLPVDMTRAAPLPPVVLIGEVHDNRVQHERRLALFRRMLDDGQRPALLMEQFDRDKQGALDRVRTGNTPDADAVIAAAGGSGWDWDFYRPFVALALERELPIVAVNVSRREAERVIRDGLAASGFDPHVPAAIDRRLSREIEGSHCGMIDGAMAHRMASAQIARDQFMATRVEAYANRGVVLLAGNGHVRRSTGVPIWLPPALRRRVQTIGLLEEGDSTAGDFDRTVVTPVQTRDDPCDAMRTIKNAP